MLGTDSVLRVMKRSVGQPADAIASAAGFDSARPKLRGSGAHSQPRVDPRDMHVAVAARLYLGDPCS